MDSFRVDRGRKHGIEKSKGMQGVLPEMRVWKYSQEREILGPLVAIDGISQQNSLGNKGPLDGIKTGQNHFW